MGTLTALTDLSLWWNRSPVPPLRPSLRGDVEADVVIVGGGFTGIWTAYYLAQLAPDLRVVVLEAGRIGFGASGRNGGWCSALFPANPARVAAEFGVEAAHDLQAAMHATVAEVGRVVAHHGIDCDWAQGGTVNLARSAAQTHRAVEYVAEMRSVGFGVADYAVLDAEDAVARVSATGVRGAVATPHCAAVDPLRLLRGVAEQAEAAGVMIFEASRVRDMGPGGARTSDGRVRAAATIRATEAYTALLPGRRRTIAPVYSLMIATEPLPESVWDEIGLGDRATFSDLRHVIIYGQRTADGRMAFGGRGAPYHFGSSIRSGFDHSARVHAALQEALVDMFPVLRGTRITHRWGGALGITRDWWAGVDFDRATGVGWAGGYVGDGVGTSNLAGRTLAALITDAPAAERQLAWVGRKNRQWEPEPMRWLGANAALAAYSWADGVEERNDRPSAITGIVQRVVR